MSDDVSAAARMPQISKIGFGDVGAAMAAGWRDFLKAPLYGLFFGGVFTLGGVLAAYLFARFGEVWMIIPFAIGFPLVGPFAAAGLYEISRRIESGEPLSWRGVLFAVYAQRERQMGWMAFVVLFVFWMWLYVVRILLALFLGFNTPASIEGFVRVVTTTSNGLTFLATGTAVGTVIAFVLFALTALSMPLLLDSNRDFVTAMITSVRGVFGNFWPMLLFAAIVGVSAMIAMVPLFVGLAIVFPVLGHATWHLYRRAITSNSPLQSGKKPS